MPFCDTCDDAVAFRSPGEEIRRACIRQKDEKEKADRNMPEKEWLHDRLLSLEIRFIDSTG
jgi:hypothetical protein